jgi:ribosomal protein L5
MTKLKNKKIFKIILNFSFMSILFNKKRTAPFFLIIELLTSQTPLLSKAKTPNIFLKIKHGDFVGCKVTIRKKKISLFLEELFLYQLRLLNVSSKKKYNNQTNKVNFSLKQISRFYPLSKIYEPYIKTLECILILNSSLLQEKNFLMTSLLLKN